MHMDDLFSQFFTNSNFGGRRQQNNRQQQDEPIEENFFGTSDVYQLDISSISRFYRRTEPWFIFFYRPNDKKSKEFKDEIIKLAEYLKGVVKVAAADCMFDEEICDEFQVYQAGTVVFFTETISEKREVYNSEISYK